MPWTFFFSVSNAMNPQTFESGFCSSSNVGRVISCLTLSRRALSAIR